MPRRLTRLLYTARGSNARSEFGENPNTSTTVRTPHQARLGGAGTFRVEGLATATP